MLKNEVKFENLTKNNILCRASLRGLKKCTSCGYINGQRATICRNLNCDLRVRRLAAIKPFDPIQLITYGQTKLYSLRTKKKLLQPRNFVSISESVGAMKSNESSVCYVDNCKYDAFDLAHFVCRHVKACQLLTNVSQAEVYPIGKSILWNLNIPVDQKQRLWDLYQLEEKLIHPIQKLNSSIFVVKCEKSKIFPAGRLHVTVFSDMVSKKRGNFSCSCKKLKIMLEPDNSVIMKREICDHLLLLLAAILNKTERKMYGSFLDSLQYLWMPTSLNTPIVECGIKTSQYMDYDKTTVKDESDLEPQNTSDIFNFTEELFAENNIPDFSDIILDVKSENISSDQQLKKPLEMPNLEMHIKDPKLNATSTSANDEDSDLHFLRIKTTEPIVTTTTTCTSMDFIDNNLSVIEQFQLNHNIKVSNDNFELAKDIESLNNNLESQLFESGITMPVSTPKQESLLKTAVVPSNNIISINTEEFKQKPCIVVSSSNASPKVAVKNIVLKQGPIKIIENATPMRGCIKKLTSNNNNNNKIMKISKINSNKVIVLKSNPISSLDKQIINSLVDPAENMSLNHSLMPCLNYESWLDHIIEVLNNSITIQDTASIKNTFHVPETIFNYFTKTFTLNSKRRLPTGTTVVKSGKYKNHIKYIWYFNQALTVEKIFSSKNLKIELERTFQRLNDGSFELYTPEIIRLKDTNNFRPIYPKIQLYKVVVQFTNNEELVLNNQLSQKCGFKLEWLPSAFPKSNFGLMTIEFCVSVKEPDVL